VTAIEGKDVVDRWRPDAQLVEFSRTRRTNLRHYGTVTRYSAIMSDGTEREVIHGQALSRRVPATRSADLTIGTAPPLSLGPEGMVMHFLLKAMETGVHGLAFGPERTRTGVKHTREEMTQVASRLSFAGSAHAAHLIADRLEEQTSADLSHMLWTGVSLGAMKGISFSALAPARQRTMVYGHFVVPVAPNPVPRPTAEQLRRYQRTEFGALMRLSAELMWHDVKDRTLRVHENVFRVSRPGLLWRYVSSMPQEPVFQIFTDAWRDAVISGDAGVAASKLPLDRLTTFELFDKDEGGPPEQWREKLKRQIARGTARVIVKHGRHGDAIRLTHQKVRARAIKSIVDAVHAGTPVDELRHPLD
jgi:hypothetical protein